MRVLIACECSGIVRDAFLSLGHDTWSCDLKADEHGSNRHMICDVRKILNHPSTYGSFDMMVAHPPCTRLCNSGVRWLTKPPRNPPADSTPQEVASWPYMSEKQRLSVIWYHLYQGAALFSECWNANIEFIAIENPVMHKHAKARIENFKDEAKHRQTVQPWQFGSSENGPNNERKRTCFWTRNLPDLVPTGTLDGSTARDSVHKASPGVYRATERSRFFPGMAKAMAGQWSGSASALN